MSDFNYKSRFERPHVDGLAHIHEGAKAFQVHQTSNQKPSTSYNKFAKKAVNVILALILIIALLPIIDPSVVKNQAEADGELNFGDVTINEGARISLAGNKSITALGSTWGDETKVFSDQTGGLDVLNENIDTSVNNFIGTNYIGDPLSKSLSKPSLLSIEDVKNKAYLMPSTDRDWWLSDIGAVAPFSWRGYAQSNNALGKNNLTVSGELEGRHYLNRTIASGPMAFTSSHKFNSFDGIGGTIFANYTNIFCYDGDYYRARRSRIFSYQTNKAHPLISKGDKLFNSTDAINYCSDSDFVSQGNPFAQPNAKEFDSKKIGKYSWKNWECSDVYYDLTGYPYFYYATTHATQDSQFVLGSSVLKSDISIVGYLPLKIMEDGRYGYPGGIKNDWYNIPRVGDTIPAGSIVYATTTSKDFFAKKSSYFRSSNKPYVYYFFFKTRYPIQINGSKVQPVPGMTLSGDPTTEISTITAAKKAIRPQMTLDTANIAFFRTISGDAIETTQTLMNSTISYAQKGKAYKCVVRDENLKLSASLTSANVLADGQPVQIDGDTIIVPYGAKTLQIDNITNTGGNYISALCSTNASYYKYALLSNSNSVNINLSSVINTNLYDSTTSMSLFSENLHADNYTDSVSAKPLSFKIKVGKGTSHCVIYDADGGTGANLPATQNVQSGSQVVLANGSMLAKDGNPFSHWLISYNDGASSPSMLLKPGEIFTMPNCDVNVKAIYSGVQIGKGSATEGYENYVITWDLNGGALGGSPAKTFVSLNRKGEKYKDPGIPIKEGDEFMGWYTSADGGTKIDFTKDKPAGNVTLYARFLPGPDYKEGDAFFAPTGTDPYKLLTGEVRVPAYSMTNLKRVATMIKNGEMKANDVFSATNDAWHLFAKISGDGSDANDWLECRIIHTGQHDRDGSGLTFQAVHALPNACKFGAGSSYVSWKDSQIYYELNERKDSSLMCELPPSLSNVILEISKSYNKPHESGWRKIKSKLWIPSVKEIDGWAEDDGSDWARSSYALYSYYKYYIGSSKDRRYTNIQGQPLRSYIISITCDRKGNKMGALTGGFVWLRECTTDVYGSTILTTFNGFGGVASSWLSDQTILGGINVCFAL